MQDEEIKAKLTELLPEAIFIDGGEWVNIKVEASQWLAFAKQLRTKSPDKYWNSYQYTVIDPLNDLVRIKRQSFINKIEEQWKK
jgi:hypothetical protein